MKHPKATETERRLSKLEDAVDTLSAAVARLTKIVVDKRPKPKPKSTKTKVLAEAELLKDHLRLVHGLKTTAIRRATLPDLRILHEKQHLKAQDDRRETE